MPDSVEFGADELTPLVRRLLGEPGAELVELHSAPLGWINLMDAALHRVEGTARVDERLIGWSLVLKRFPRPDDTATAASPDGWDYWQREINVYSSAALESLPEPLAAPRFAGAFARADGARWLGLEEIGAIEGEPWDLDRFEVAARAAGAFNGVYLTGKSPPSAEGLGPGGLRSWVEMLATYLAGPIAALAHGRLATLATPRPDDLQVLLSGRGLLLEALDRLPQTFVHRDLTPVNVLVPPSRDQPQRFVAVDWALAGLGALGEDAAGLVGATLWQLLHDLSDAGALEERVLRGYIDGLRAAGWKGDEVLVRFGYLTTLALRFAPLTPVWADDLDDAAKAEWFGSKFGRPSGQIALAWGQLQAFVLDRGAEALRSAAELPGVSISSAR